MNLAIKGHYTRGEEVIKILEMLGGINVDNLDGNATHYYYTIMNDKKIIGAAFYLKDLDDKFYILSLEEFLEKFPYKVGDKVQFKGVTSLGPVYEIEQMKWEDNQVKYIICDLYWKNIKCTATTENLQPYKEETMEEEGVYAYNEINCYHQDFGDKVRIRLGGDYEIKVEGKITYIVKKQPQYPKTYEECCKVLFPNTIELGKVSAYGYNGKLLEKFGELLICRDAYWKIEEGWKEKRRERAIHYVICSTLLGEVIKDTMPNCIANYLLDFPTEEMRNAFFENFKDLIEECKELL